ncbi:MAG: isochorismatase family protein [Desulfobacterota bacterium]|nr:isochorismatase family protein [Thermodesulfobacteriota bacterium]MDW8001860.1 isochorismatase family protein [Deltaproteobacteria bacterium]
MIEPDDCLVVVIDMQERLVPVVAENESLIQSVVKLLKFSKLMNIPVLFTEQDKLGSTIKEVRDVYDVKPVSKIHFNSFLCPEFEAEVEKSKKRTLVIAGVESHICVLQTALHALQSFSVHVLYDAVSSRSLFHKNIAIERMRKAGCVISTTEIFMFELLKRAGTQIFKEALSLIK